MSIKKRITKIEENLKKPETNKYDLSDWSTDYLKYVIRSLDDNKPLPDELIEKINRSRVSE